MSYPLVRLENLSINAVVQMVIVHPVVRVRTSLGCYGCYVGHIPELNLEPRAVFVGWYPGSIVVQTSLGCKIVLVGATGSQGGVWDGAVL